MELKLCLSSIVLLIVGVNAKSDARIIGGQTAETGQFPFAVAINVQTGDSRHFCGGALLSLEWVLSSASCINNGVLFTMQLGSVNLTTPDDNRATFESSEFVVHPDFDPITLQNDIGLIKLPKQVTMGTTLLNINMRPDTLKPETPLTILGWGQTSDSNDDLSEQLLYTETSALSNDECKVYYGDQVSDNMICVVGNSNEGTCTGDNGGPLLQIVWNRYYVVGVASFISGNGCESTDPSGFTRIGPYYLWIRQQIGLYPW